jgi:hypothetical protein
MMLDCSNGLLEANGTGSKVMGLGPNRRHFVLRCADHSIAVGTGNGIEEHLFVMKCCEGLTRDNDTSPVVRLRCAQIVFKRVWTRHHRKP